jgi:hypothetical protein
MWQEEFEKLNDSERDTFAKVINYLLMKTFVLRYKYDLKEKVVVRNPSYSFIERNFTLIKEYLKISGFSVVKDLNEGVFQLANKFDTNYKRLDRLTTLILYILRLIYSEEKEKLSLRNEIIITISSVVEKLKIIGIFKNKPSDKAWEEALLTIKHFNIVDKIEGSWNEPDTQLIIYPSILFIVPDEKINEIYEYAKPNEAADSDLDEITEDEVIY